MNKITLDDLLNQFEKEYKEGEASEQRLLEHFQNKGINIPYVKYLKAKYANEEKFDPFL
ncbi:hypothetical protein FACS1894110_23780 [Spirochaetia bacterium]|nr:hypothetical protein FACS1894110_23780 [Spirochaetia bacterium]